ncbi:YxlC family protein [Bacillus atrophaeus]|uniref:YxlC family protein n=1 Tax=Bacillus atrophaeus TaxID=1452 RepID=UPI0031BAB210
MNKEKLSAHLQTELDKIDQSAEPTVPDQKELLQQLSHFKEVRRKSILKEGIAFLFCALAVVSIFALAVSQIPAVFIFLQACAFLSLPVLVMAEKKRQPPVIEVKRR